MAKAFRMAFTYDKPNISVQWAKRVNGELRIELEAIQRAEVDAMYVRARANSNMKAYRLSDPKQRRLTPYGHQPKAPMPTFPYVANNQTNELYNGWRKGPPTWNGDILESKLENVAPEARFFAGIPTVRMVARPLLQQLVKESRGNIQIENRDRWEKFWTKQARGK